MKRGLCLLLVTLGAVAISSRPAPSDDFDDPDFDVVEAGIPQLIAALESGRINSKQLVKLYLDRIAAFQGTLNAFIRLNPDAIRIAQQRDRERERGHIRGPLHGIPIVLKDNVHTTDMITTGGALAFKDLRPPYEATLSRKLRAAGAIILGKTVLTELANWVAQGMPGNYSAVGGYGMNPYDPRPDPRPGTDVFGNLFADGRPAMGTGGSSSGIATSANLAAANVGTETSGSILSPSNATMLAGIKPTVGLISRYGVIPITADQDIAGPMARDVASAAIMLGVMAGFDPNDSATIACFTPGNCRRDYTPFLRRDGLRGARIAVPQIGFFLTLNDAQKAVVNEAIAILRDKGATVDLVDIPSYADGTAQPWGVCANLADSKANDDTNCSVVLKYGFKRDFNKWLDTLGNASRIDTLTQLMAFNEAHAAEGAIKYGQARLFISEEMDLVADAPRYSMDRAKDIDLTATRGIDATMAGPDHVAGTTDDYDALLFGGASSAGIAARPGYPTVIVPFGFVPNAPTPAFPAGFNAKDQPFGISFTGSAFDEPTLIKLAYAFEQASKRRVSPSSAPPLGDDDDDEDDEDNNDGQNENGRKGEKKGK